MEEKFAENAKSAFSTTWYYLNRQTIGCGTQMKKGHYFSMNIYEAKQTLS